MSGFINPSVAESVADPTMAAKEAGKGIETAAQKTQADGTSPQGLDIQNVQEKYGAERDKRLAVGDRQYIDLPASDKFRHLSEDPWVESERKQYDFGPPALNDGDSYEVLILGAGFGGILAAVRLIQAGLSVDNLRLVDPSGGFGGTWYWNRYPGLMCDVESYLYLPLLEEMGYMPKHKYSYGYEIRSYINKIVDKYNIRKKGILQTNVKGIVWDEGKKRWDVTLKRKTGEEMKVHAQFVISSAGTLNTPKIPNADGIADFEGSLFHTSRFDYGITGGSQEDPSLTKLKGKTVGIIGTGATAIQLVPQLAKWAKKVYVIQRTPTAVDWRGQQETDPDRFAKEVANQKNWQRARNSNFNARMSNWPDVPELDLVGDAWTNMPSYKAVTGGPNKITTSDTIPAHVGALHALDFERQERIRRRIHDFVKDPDTAEKLKPWYPGFCKRPSFHDDYLPTFNEPHVELVDTDGKGVDEFTKNGVVVGGKGYDMDVLILSTGYRIDTSTLYAGITIQGRDGIKLNEKFDENWNTLHGMTSRGFPNYFAFAPLQSGASANFTFVLDQLSQHMAYIVSEAKKKAGSESVTIEPTAEAEENWSIQIAMRAGALAGMAGCTPSYLNFEGARDNIPPEYQMKAARMATWGEGLESFIAVLEKWRADGGLEGLEINTSG